MTICEYSETMTIGIFDEDMNAMPKPIRQFYRSAKRFFKEDVFITLIPSSWRANGEPVLDADTFGGMEEPISIRLADLNMTDAEMGKLFKYIMFSDNVSVW